MWNVRFQRTIRGLALFLAALGIIVALVWIFADAPNRVHPANAKIFYTTHQLRSEFWPGSTWLALLGGIIAASLIGVPSGLQFACLFPFVPPLKAWAFIVISQVFSTWLILRIHSGRGLSGAAAELGEAAAGAGDPLRLAWFLRLLLGLPNRSIDLALAARTDAVHPPRRLALWSLPGHSLRAAGVGLWIHAISLLIIDFRPFPEYDFALAGTMTVVLSFFWLLPWIPELIPGGAPVQKLVSLCAGGVPALPEPETVPQGAEAPQTGAPAAPAKG
ncbi:MAG TPA: hypothetical protein PLU72_04875 [Candidatus Ozemobacteraceae bacterium]|nr:hypothetical protein [Candidatus Ozemobacteraceae bacterium]HQG27167.1 hypothetical protein [Candidatus Ozemobacteraceae bacterium]